MTKTIYIVLVFDLEEDMIFSFIKIIGLNMAFSFIDEEFIQYIKFLEQQITQDLKNEDEEVTSWAESFYEIKFLFSENFLYYYISMVYFFKLVEVGLL
ncbi:MAG: hypothetical protein RR614_12300 [Eubacterium sp.]